MCLLRKTGLGLFLISCLIKGVVAQRPFAHHNHENFAQVSSIVQDSSGFLWINASGLGRFDGYDLTEYLDSSGNRINGQIRVNPAGDVWVFEYGQLYRYMRKRDKFITYTPNLNASSITVMAFEPAEGIWLGTYDGGITIFNPLTNTTTQYKNPLGDSTERARNNLILDIQVYPNHLLMGTSLGLWQFDKETKQFSRPTSNVNKTPLLSASPIRKIFRYHDHYWFYKPAHLIKTDLDFNIIQQFDFPEELELVEVPWNVDRDSTGVFWIASYGKGIWSYDPTTNNLKRYIHNADNPQSIASDILQCAFVNHEQNVWTGTYDQGFEQLKAVSLIFNNAYLPGKATPGTPQILTTSTGNYLLQDSKTDGLWMAQLTSDLGNIKFSPVETNPPIKGLHTTNSLLGKDFWWIGTWEDGLLGVPLNPRTRLPDKSPIKTIKHYPGNPYTLDDKSAGAWLEHDGHLWVTSPHSTLFRINLSGEFGKPNALTRYQYIPDDSTSLSPGVIWGVRPGINGSYWILTSLGLDRWNKGRIEHIFNKTQTSKSQHLCLAIGRNGQLYLGGFDGLVIGKPENGKY